MKYVLCSILFFQFFSMLALADFDRYDAATTDRKYFGYMPAYNCESASIWEITSGPTWVKVDTHGFLHGIPKTGDLGENNLTISYANKAGCSGTATMQIAVNSVLAPNWSIDELNTHGSSHAWVGFHFYYEFGYWVNSGSQLPESYPLTYTLEDAPAWISITEKGVLIGEPKEGDIGTYRFRVRATNALGGYAKTKAFVKVTSYPGDK